MLPQARHRFIEIQDGEQGSIETLARMRELVLASDPIVELTVRDILSQPVTEVMDPYELAHAIFEWVRAHMLYTPDVDGVWQGVGHIIEEIRTPGYTLYEIEKLGAAIGDCDDYVILLCALYARLGYACRMVAISRADDQMLDHVYMQLRVGHEWITADAIVEWPFGWEVPQSEVTNRVEYPI